MINKRINKNLLPLLAITALMLSVGLANYSQISGSKVVNTQSVLSDSDEKNDEDVRKNEEKNEEKKDDVKGEVRNEVKAEKRVVSQTIEKPETRIEIVDIDEEVDVKNEIENEIETESEQESETASADGMVKKFKLKVKTRTIAGKTVIETEAGEVKVENNPEDAINDVVRDGLLDEPTSFEVKTNDNNKVEFEIRGTESKKFLGLINVVIPKILTVSSENGDVVSTNQSVWSRFLSFLSI